MATEIANGIEYCRAEYSVLPLPATLAPPGTDTDTDTSSAHPFVSLLMGKEPETETRQNPLSIDFLEGIKPAKKSPPKEAPII